MLTQPRVQRYAVESDLRDIRIAEKEVVLTFLLQLLSERGILDRLAFKGGTCLRKIFVGSQGRFSTDLDFTFSRLHHGANRKMQEQDGAGRLRWRYHERPVPG
jgi:predicted nucleotidyltransferase component of viral defense system